MSVMFATFDEPDCFGGPRPNDSIPLHYLVDVLAATSYVNLLPSIRNTFPEDTIRHKTEIKAQLPP